MTEKNLLIELEESTVITEYTPQKREETWFQSEEELERSFIKQLESQSYEYINIKNEEDLKNNLKIQLEKLNDIVFTENEWEIFFKKEIANPSKGVVEKTKIIQENYIITLKRDDGSEKNIYLINKKDIYKNSLQVINQYENNDGIRQNRYDVTILVNGFPLVHVELKRRGVNLKEAFNQINRYSRESFWAGSGLFEYINIFVISNGTFTKYYSNTTRLLHVKNEKQRKGMSFEFTSYWADSKNRQITDIVDFTGTFFEKNTLLNIITRYCVLTIDNQLLVMRPYQITATEKVLQQIYIAYNSKKEGTIDAGGFIWHTTGSGKTLTSFKTAQLITKRYNFIDKVLFVVDRKDLDYQTISEYNKFSEGCVNGNSNTKILTSQLEDNNCRIIVTTIQKLSIFCKKNVNHSVYNKNVVIIFDECHRSQFGDMHLLIEKNFKKYYIFGFTGTPIYAINANSNGVINRKTTEQIFGKMLHSYTIINAINDKNVLPFRIDYCSTMKAYENIEDKKVKDIDRNGALMSPKRIEKIVEYILNNFDNKTFRNTYYNLKEKRLSGFNSILATASIDFAKLYYKEFKKQKNNLKIALIYSFGVNEDEEGFVDENLEDTDKLDDSSRNFLEEAIKDYNNMFSTNFNTSGESFQNYYKDVSRRVKEREIDLLIVVNMFLTGFDAATLNTLWVDKNLKYHGLLQAFSRTNRILNSVKTFGNIVCFRNLENEINNALALFGDDSAKGIILLKTFEEYYNGYKNEKNEEGYKQLIEQLVEDFPFGKEMNEEEEKNFIKLYGNILKLKNILSVFDDFKGKKILSERDFQDYQSIYIDLYEKFKKHNDKEKIDNDIEFEIELIKQVDVNVDYILIKISEYHKKFMKNEEILSKVSKLIDSSFELRNKKDLIKDFILSLTPKSNIDEDWEDFIEEKKVEELDKIINEENLNKTKTYNFIKESFENNVVKSYGTSISELMPPISRFNKNVDRTGIKEKIFNKLLYFFERFKGLCKEKNF